MSGNKVRKTMTRGLETAWIELPCVGKPKGICIFLHGFPDSADTWNHQLKEVASLSLIAVAPYSRGIPPSASSDDLNRYSSPAVCLDLQKVVEEVDPTGMLPLWFVGHDLGTVYASQAARHFRKRTRGLVVLNGLHHRQMLRRLKNPNQALRSWYLYIMQVPKLPQVLLEKWGRSFLLLAYRLGGLPKECRPESPRLDGLTSGVHQYRSLFQETLRELLQNQARLTCPTLVIWGKNDQVLLPPTMDEWEAEVEQPVIRMIEAGHWPHLEQPSEVNRLLTEFLNKPGASA